MNFTEIDITELKNGLVVRTDCFWLCADGDKKRALFYGNSPQCNTNKEVLRFGMGRRIYPVDTEIVFIPIAYVPNRD